MIFTSFNFLVFFPIVTALFWLTPAKQRWATLLAANYFFYINSKPVYALLLAGVTFSTYLFARLIGGTTSESRKKCYLLIDILLVLLPLFLFKYFGFVNEGIIQLLKAAQLRWPLPEIKYILPVGISFYTFMAIGYAVDVYNEKIGPEKNLGIIALFVSFFPLLLSGPIERAGNLLPQFKERKKPDYVMLVQGLKLMLWGYFMKLVVADRLAIYIDAVYENISRHNGTSLLFASGLYPFQVYADLGGYSLIAIGTAKALGIDVMANFKRPFFATSMSEFWRRWHISLISWLTDYVYTPLSFAFRKYKVWGIVIALMITFFISGIWHGAAMNFVIWGLMQGLFLSIEALGKNKKAAFEKKHDLGDKNWYALAGMSLTFVLFAASQIFGRAARFNDALVIFNKIFTAPGKLFIGAPSTLIFGFTGLLILFLKDLRDEFRPSAFLLFENKRKFIRITAYASLIIIILLIGVFDGGQFIYFKY